MNEQKWCKYCTDFRAKLANERRRNSELHKENERLEGIEKTARNLYYIRIRQDGIPERSMYAPPEYWLRLKEALEDK